MQAVLSEPTPTTGATPSVFRRILVAIDFSAASEATLKAAMTLGQQFDADVTLLHVIEGFPGEPVFSGARAARAIDSYEAKVELANQRLEKMVPADARFMVRHQVASVTGVARHAILQAAAERDADLIVIGASGHGRLEHAVVGSTVKSVLKQAKSAVLVVPV